MMAFIRMNVVGAAHEACRQSTMSGPDIHYNSISYNSNLVWSSQGGSISVTPRAASSASALSIRFNKKDSVASRAFSNAFKRSAGS